jgi:hypothetical protein
MTTNAHSKGYYCSPKWLFDAGCKSYDYLLQRGWSFDRALDFMAANHVTLINDNVGKVPPDQMPKLEQLARRAGYRFALREISHPDSLARGETLTVNMKWSNLGVGKLYRRYSLVLYLLDSKGVVGQQDQADVDPTSWLPGDQSVAATLRLPGGLQAGQYTLGLALVDPTSKKPAIRLAIDAPQTDRLYRLSSVRVK